MSLLWLSKKAFYGRILFPIVHLETGYQLGEIYRFRDEYAKKWGFNLIVAKNQEALDRGVNPHKGKLECCTELKTNALKKAIAENSFQAIYLGIRRDEHGIRAKERFFSPRNENFEWDYKNQPPELWDQYKTKARDEEHLRGRTSSALNGMHTYNDAFIYGINCDLRRVNSIQDANKIVKEKI